MHHLHGGAVSSFLPCILFEFRVQIITRGGSCITPNCKTRIHNHCFRKLRARNSQCPACAADWPQDPTNLRPIGEAAVKDGQDDGRRVRRKSTTASGDEAEEEMRMDEDEPELSQPRQSQRRGKKKTVRMDVDEDEDEDGDEGAPRKSQATRRRSTRTR